MKKITQEELEVFLRKHKLWLVNAPDGERADLYGADLYGADLSGADLRGANFYRANLSRANLSGADLSGADISGADLYGANLSGADLSGADLRGANFYRADLRGAENINCPMTCPEEGSFIGFKKVGVGPKYIVKLEIPEAALRSSATSRKCRCSSAKVLSITNLDGTATDIQSICSSYDRNFIYTIGETVRVDNFDTDRWNECAPGIHFFITRQEAVDY